MIKKENALTTEEYLAIRSKVNWKELKKEQAQKALENSLYTIAVYEEGELIGIGRVVGDGAVICYIQDLIVVPQRQGTGIGSFILKNLIDYVEGLRQENTEMMLCLMCAKGREKFYEKHEFLARPTNNLGPGMIQYLRERL